MPGRGGKLTNEALRTRGPRLILAEVEYVKGDHDNPAIHVIFREGQGCFKATGFSHSDFTFEDAGRYFSVRTVAKSFSFGYLMKIGRVNQKVR